MAEGKKIQVLMVCAMGMSSSLIEQKVAEVAASKGVEMELKAVDIPSIGRVNFEKDPVDMVLIAPQARFKIRSVTKAAEPFGVVVVNMDPVAYGMIDGEKIFKQIMDTLQESSSKE
jgi:PTS system cellobiose-specific IIB component